MTTKPLATATLMLICVGAIIGQSTPKIVVADKGPFVSLPDDPVSELIEITEVKQAEPKATPKAEPTEAITVAADKEESKPSPVIVDAPDEVEQFEAPAPPPEPVYTEPAPAIYEPPIYAQPSGNGSSGGGGVSSPVFISRPVVTYTAPAVSYGSTGSKVSSVRTVTRVSTQPSWTGTPIVVRRAPVATRIAPVVVRSMPTRRTVHRTYSSVATQPTVSAVEVVPSVASFPAVEAASEKRVTRTRTSLLGRILRPGRVECENGQCRIVQ